ncbi:MAG: hypothetical protein KDJ87_10640 [Rhizobiaceae bacterium]|nr:hypothetical protein [Rhizobiaceae bacterium]
MIFSIRHRSDAVFPEQACAIAIRACFGKPASLRMQQVAPRMLRISEPQIRAN